MPSPKRNLLHVLIRSAPWLDPVESEPLEIPCNIQVGEVVEVPGVLRALIRNETATRPWGKTFSARERVSLIASFERLHRALPEFHGSSDIEIRYPLQLSPPRYLDCVAKGDRIRFSWRVSSTPEKNSAIICLTYLIDPPHLSCPLPRVMSIVYEDPTKKS
jgi:hypothetical protein